MKIKSAYIIEPKLVYNKGQGFAFSPKIDVRESLLGELYNSIILSFNDNEIITWIKNVAITKEEYEKLQKEHQKIMDNDYEWYDWDFPLCYNLENAYDTSIFTKEELSQTYYYWTGWEIFYAESYLDVTYVYQEWRTNDHKWVPDREEYYKTSEVLEVLEKWKEALERWNNPEEKKKMIEEFEQNN